MPAFAERSSSPRKLTKIPGGLPPFCSFRGTPVLALNANDFRNKLVEIPQPRARR